MVGRRVGFYLVIVVLAGCQQVNGNRMDFPSTSRPGSGVNLQAQLGSPAARLEEPMCESGSLFTSQSKAPPSMASLGSMTRTSGAHQVSGKDGEKPPKAMLERLRYPDELPGGKTPEIKLPPPGASKQEIEAAYQKYFAPLPPLAALPPTQSGPFFHPLTLDDLQGLAQSNSPLIKQAVADVDAARGGWVQAGLYPNPTVGYQGDAMNQGHSSGTQGGFAEQLFKTAHKLPLARAVAERDIQLAELKVVQTESDVRTQVRSQYFALLAARKNLDVNRALAELTDEVYQVLVLQLKVGLVATYEPMQVRVLALQARGFTLQARNRYLSAWKQLAAAMGMPEMALTDVAGQIDMAIPHFEFEPLLAQVLARHSDMQSAQTSAEKARVQLRLAQVQPIPDVDVRVAIQKDTTNQPHAVTAGVQVGIALPVWDRNQGNIQQALANVQKANSEGHRVRAALSGKVAEAFERYDNNRKLLELYRTQMLPSQVQAFRGAVARHARAGEKGGVSYNDLVSAEQTLVTLLTSYLGALKDQWDAVVDIGGLLQTNDLFQVEGDPVAPIPDPRELCLPALPQTSRGR